MALLINKLFSSKKKAYDKHQDVCERAFTFSKEQVRVVLFRECDFRGRKLLFDSQTVQKVPVSVTTPNKQPLTVSAATGHCNKNEIYVEISNGYGYQYTRPSGDIVQLGEMVFGSVAMSFRGTSFKIHSFSSPSKFMCTQVFPSPKYSARGRLSLTSNIFSLKSDQNDSVQSLEKSAKLDYSSASSTTSFTEQISGHSTESDIKIVPCSGSFPLDVPLNNNSMNSSKLDPSLEGDSGFCGEQSYSSVSSGHPSVSLWDARQEHVNVQGFSCGSLYKRWLRSASTSLDYNTCSDSSLSGIHSSVSADECMTRGHHRTNKLGLAVIIQLSENQEFEMERFLLEHSALIEAMVCRARTGVESAYTRPGSFASLMYEVYREICQWLSDLITGPTISTYLWHVIGPQTRDRPSESSEYSYCSSEVNCDSRNHSLLDFTKTKSDSNLVRNNSTSDLLNRRTRINLLSNSFDVKSSSKFFESDSFKLNVHRSLSRHLRSDIFKSEVDKMRSFSRGSGESSLCAEKFIKELCELLESVDVKHTNFFISTLLTAVLTHHLGWVSTVLPPSQFDKDTISKLRSPCNPLWGQLTDLYGAVGYPTKMSRTVICGNNKAEIITRILNILTYFIRCSSVERNFLSHYSPYESNIEENMKNNVLLDDHKTNIEANKDTMMSHSERNSLINVNGKMEELEMATLKLPSQEVEEDQSRLSPGERSNETLINDIRTNNNNNTDVFSNMSTKKFEIKKFKSCLNNLCSTDNFFSFNSSQETLKYEDSKLNLTEETKEKGNDSETNQYLIKRKQICEKIKKNTSFSDLSTLVDTQLTEVNDSSNDNDKANVIFVLGDNEELIGLKKNQNNVLEEDSTKHTDIPSSKQETLLNIPSSSSLQRPKDLKLPNKMLFTCGSSDSSPDESSSSSNCVGVCADISPCSECEKMRKRSGSLQAGSSKTKETLKKIVLVRSSLINLETEFQKNDNTKTEVKRREDFSRSQSVPPSDKNQRKCSKSGCKKKYSGVKFDIRQYPQIVTNYMKSKDLELFQVPFGEKSLKLNRSFSVSLYSDALKLDFPSCDCEPSDGEVLQTPSNASELEFTSDLTSENYESHHSTPKRKHSKENQLLKENNNIESTTVDEVSNLEGDKMETSVLEHPLQSNSNENNAMFEHEIDNFMEQNENSQLSGKMVYIDLPSPSILLHKPNKETVGYTHSLFRGVSEKYISDMVLQGTTSLPRNWEHLLKRDLNLSVHQPLLDQPVHEAVAIVANTDTWEVQLVSSHTYVVERGSFGIRVCMSQLVANMLESLLHMWKLHTPSEYCLMHIEARLREFCLRSKALAQLLMTTEFCNMDHLTSAMQLEVNDIPLLMAVASTHTPQVTQKYGLSFQ